MRDYYSFSTEYGASDELFRAVLSLDKKRVEALRAAGVTLSADVKLALVNGGMMISNTAGTRFWYAYLSDLRRLGNEDFVYVSRTFFEETGAPLFYSDDVHDAVCKYLFNAEVFACLMDCYNQEGMNKKLTMQGLIRENNLALLKLCVRNGWLEAPKLRDQLIEYSNKVQSAEVKAFLVDYKNNSFDLAEERAKAKEKRERELNAKPDPVIELSKLWSWKKGEDGGLIITSYKGKEKEVTVPARIGNNIVTAIGDHALSYSGLGADSEKSSRLGIERIIVPSGIKTIGKEAFWQRLCYDGYNALKEVILPETLDVFTDRHAAKTAPSFMEYDRECYVVAVVPRSENARFYCVKNCIRFRFADEAEDAKHIPLDEIIESDELFSAIISGDEAKYNELKKNGAVLTNYIRNALSRKHSHDGILKVVQEDFNDSIFYKTYKNAAFILSALKAELDEPLYYTDYFIKPTDMEPEKFDRILEYFDVKFPNKTEDMQRFIDGGRTEHLSICAKHGWLDNPAVRDKLIQYASDNNKIEATAWLLDFKFRTADLEAERKRAEKKAERELNANPNSLSVIKKTWKFEKREDGSVIITGYKGSGTDVRVPEKICGDIVTAIDEYAFSPNAERLRKEQRDVRRAITNVTFPDTIESVGEYAFRNCEALTGINFPKSLSKISRGMLENTGFEEIIIDGHIKRVGASAFYICRSLKHVTLCEGVAEIGSNAFYNCTELETIDLPRSLERVPSNVMPSAPFWKCDKLTALVYKGSYAEAYCKENNIAYKYKDEE